MLRWIYALFLVALLVFVATLGAALLVPSLVASLLPVAYFSGITWACIGALLVSLSNPRSSSND